MDYYSPENWYIDSSKTLSEEKLRLLEHYLNKKGYVVLLHAHFCGGRGATPSAYDDFDELKEYLEREAKPGDVITAWPFPTGEPITTGKFPDDKGQIPRVGAY